MNEYTDEAQQEWLRRREQRRLRKRRIVRRRRMVALAVLLVLLGAVVSGGWWLCDALTPDAPVLPLEPEVSAPIQTTTRPEAAYPMADENTYLMGEELDADCAVLLDATTGRIVAQKQPDKRIYPASVTKVMTLLVAVERISNFEETFTMPYEMLNRLFVQEASVAGFSAGEAVCMTDLLYGCILPSGADATEALALHIAGGEAEFAVLMNQKAEELGLKDTRFVNTSGLHDGGHYTTPTDMAVVLRAAMENPLCRQVLTTYKYTTNPTKQHPEGLELVSTMFKRMYGDEPEGATIIGGKTGYTSQAGYTMVSYAVGQDGHDYIFASMQGTDGWGATYDAIGAYTRYCVSKKSGTE